MSLFSTTLTVEDQFNPIKKHCEYQVFFPLFQSLTVSSLRLSGIILGMGSANERRCYLIPGTYRRSYRFLLVYRKDFSHWLSPYPEWSLDIHKTLMANDNKCGISKLLPSIFFFTAYSYQPIAIMNLPLLYWLLPRLNIWLSSKAALTGCASMVRTNSNIIIRELRFDNLWFVFSWPL